MAADVRVGLFQRINKAEGRFVGTFVQVIPNGFIYIPASQHARDDSFGFHALLRDLAVLRTRSRKQSK